MARRKMNLLRVAISALCLVLVTGGNGFATVTECPTFDEFGDINCEDLSARLDNFSVALQTAPDSQATIIIYEGKYRRGQNPRRGEALANAARIKDYLVNNRGLSAQRIVLVNGGHRADFTVQLFVCPRGVTPTASSTVGANVIKFRKGKVSKREYKWSCLE
ncbi:MAG TPA: hypothetical protein VF791_21285 [Pyrinomonadaceae bacterium]